MQSIMHKLIQAEYYSKILFIKESICQSECVRRLINKGIIAKNQSTI